MMRIDLLHFSPKDPDAYIATIMRRTRDLSAIEDIRNSLDEKEGWTERLVRGARIWGHYDVFEHVVYWFSVEGVSRALTHQLVRHRLASYSQLSGRLKNIEVAYVTPQLEYVSDENKRRELLATFERIYRQQFKDYEMLVSQGVAIEDARYILPNGQMTAIMMTVNARSLMHILRMRLDPAAQWEIREMAERMLALVRPTAPILWEKIPEDI
jgi:thymidylate synthase (FAD)